ncbi:hypothetical protein ACFQ2M_38310 [Kitasatospora saccharophila]|uniref:hypothetical protein n=1 Tax=Kitasatospora saccharophila TaxID=407973 RepID=UPI0036335D23
MTAGDEIVIRYRGLEVRVRAVLTRMDELGPAGTTEFNVGTDVQHSRASNDGATNFGAGSGHTGNFATTVTVPVAGFVPVTVGVLGNHGRGRDLLDIAYGSTTSGGGTKAKVSGSAYRGRRSCSSPSPASRGGALPSTCGAPPGSASRASSRPASSWRCPRPRPRPAPSRRRGWSRSSRRRSGPSWSRRRGSGSSGCGTPTCCAGSATWAACRTWSGRSPRGTSAATSGGGSPA